MQLKSFQARLSLLFTLLLILVFACTFWVINQKNIENAKQTILHDLDVTSDAFQELLNTRTQSLFDIVRPATSDFAFLRAVNTKNEDTIISAMNNLLSRIVYLPADTMLIIGLDGQLIASTNNKFSSNPWPWLITKVENASDNYYETTAIIVFDKQVYQVIVTPLNAAGVEAWIVVGFPIDESFASDTRSITGRDLSVVIKEAENNLISATSMPSNYAPDILKNINTKKDDLETSYIFSLKNENFISIQKQLSNNLGGKTAILLQGSLDKALEPYKRLNRTLLVIFLFGLLFAILATVWLSRSISRPLESLTRIVRRINKGDYSQRLEVERKDELGVLAESVNNMAQGLAEKEQVRNLLGKVVSDEIATELLSKKVELGGEEKVVAVLFSDVRNFTAMCEGAAPTEILTRLNRYFNKVSIAIEKHKGVVDKYIGDAIMALYGAPVSYTDSSDKAIASALEMKKALGELNNEFLSEGIPALEMGIGINTGKVVVGNMGSEQRMNYTVIGDNVNLASRLEGLTKYYGCAILLSEGTKALSSRYVFREVDIVKVKGKQEAVTIYEPVCLEDELTDSVGNELKQHAEALDLYRAKDWALAKQKFSQLVSQCPDVEVYKFFQKHCETLLNSSSPESWQAITELTNK